MHLKNIAEYFGPYAKQFLESCRKRAEYFDEDGEGSTDTLI
jgi:hypothetical protein